MNITPSYKVITPVLSVYVLCLFLPTIDLHATLSLDVGILLLTFPIPSLIFPIIYPISDSITEVYGKKVAYFLMMVSYISIIIFSFINNFLISYSNEKQLFDVILRQSLLLTIIGPIGYLITSFININFISKFKLKLRGKHFIFRSLICSGISETLLSLIVLPVVFYQMNLLSLSKLILDTVLIKVLITVPFVFIARFLVFLYRKIDDLSYTSYNKTFLNSGVGEIN